jgi:hypothetical protein
MSNLARTYVVGTDERVGRPPLFRKVETSRLDYSFDWSKYLAGDTIVEFFVETTTNISIEPATLTGSIVSFWVTPDADVGVTHPISCTITTAAGVRDTRTMNIAVVITR